MMALDVLDHHSRAKIEIDRVRKSVKSALEELDGVARDLADADDEIDYATDGCNGLSETIESLESEVAELRSEVEELRAALAAREGEV